MELDQTSRWFVIGLAIVTILYAALRPLMRKKDPLSKPPAFTSLAQQRSVERQMQNVLVELSEMSRQITAQLDTRAAKLEAMIREADEKIATLKALQGSAGGISSGAAPAPLSPVERGGNLPADPIVDPSHAMVYALADQGRSQKDIAQELNRPSGEIELILALRR
jgi:hypothetical protein